MPDLSIKGVPGAWAEALRRQAAANHRSLQGELMALVERAVVEEHRSGKVPLAARPASETVGTKSVQQIAAELRARFPEPISGQPLGVDIVRASRDSR
jgi:plasmid stability protein